MDVVRALTTFALILVTAFVAVGGASPLEEDVRSNIVLMLADDLQHLPQTRRLLVEEGLTFSNAFVTHSLCCPSRASILRGQYTHNHQVLTNVRPDGGFERFRDQGHEDSTVATWLQGGGYQTALLGKYLNGYPGDDETYMPTGWDEWYAKLTGDDYYGYDLNDNGTIVSQVRRARYRGRGTLQPLLRPLRATERTCHRGSHTRQKPRVPPRSIEKLRRVSLPDSGGEQPVTPVVDNVFSVGAVGLEPTLDGF